MLHRVLALEPASYQRHEIHSDESRLWAETNCYVDIWIELLHALGHDPVAALPFTFAIDFEGDQWTFFKFPLLDLYELYGLDVQELSIWRPLVSHVEEQVSRGRPVLAELDSYYLPDTVGSAYRITHQKSTVAIVDIDTDARTLGYFHGQSFYRVEGDDFCDVLRLREPRPEDELPPYCEFVKLRRAPGEFPQLVQKSLGLLRRHLELAPSANPFEAFRERFQRDLSGLLDENIEKFHQYSFATLRQFGACYELSARYLRWLGQNGESGLDDAASAFRDISERAKTFQFQLARAMARKKPLDLTPLDAMANRWKCGISQLKARCS